MRIKYTQLNDRAKIVKKYTWAKYLLKLADGFMMFECLEDYSNYCNQNV